MLAGCGPKRVNVVVPPPTSGGRIPGPAPGGGGSGGFNMAAPQSPDPRMTPGATLPVTSGDFCTSGYSKKVRNVPSSVKRQVYEAYGIRSRKRGEYEVDHLISLQLGGSNSIKNLWPQSYKTQPWNAYVKDALENELHRQICAGQLDAKTAQQDIARDWIAAYKKYFHTDRPTITNAPRSERSRPAAFAMPSDNQPDMGDDASSAASAPVSPGNGQVWVNTKSGKYFLPGARYYGKTKQGEYMSEADAKRRDYQSASGNGGL